MPVHCHQECPVWGAVKKDTLVSGPGAKPLSGVASTLVWQDVFGVSAPARETSVHSSVERDRTLSEQQGS